MTSCTNRLLALLACTLAIPAGLSSCADHPQSAAKGGEPSGDVGKLGGDTSGDVATLGAEDGAEVSGDAVDSPDPAEAENGADGGPSPTDVAEAHAEEAAADATTSPPDTPAIPLKPTSCVVDKKTNFVQGLSLDQLPPGYPYTAPVRPAAKPDGWASNGVWFNSPPGLVEGHAIQAYQNHVYVADTEGNNVLDYSTSLQLLRKVNVPEPRQVSVSLGGALYALYSAGTIGLLGPGASSFTPLVTLQAPISCFLIWKDQYVVTGDSQNGEIAAHSLESGKVVWRAQTYGIPQSLASDGTHLIVTLQTGAPRRIALPSQWTPDPGNQGALQLPSMALPLRGKNPWHLYDTQLGNIHADWPSSHAFAATSDGDRVLVAHSLAVTGSEDAVSFAKDLGIDPSLVVLIKKNVYYGFTLGDPCKSVPVRPLEMAVSAFAKGEPVLGQANLVTRDPVTDRNLLALFDQPMDIRVHPTRTLAFVAARGTDNVLVLNTRGVDPMQIPIAVLATGKGPVGVAVAAGMPYAYTFNVDDRTVSRIALAPLLAVIDTGNQLTAMPEPLHLAADLHVTVPGYALTNSDWFAGRRLFHAANNPQLAATGRQACASCHIAGRDDKLVWATTKGMRQTISLAGRVSGTAPYGWSGEFGTIEEKIAQGVEHMGGGGLSTQQTQQLATYIEKLKLPPTQFEAPPAWLYLDGKALFESSDIGCAVCHSGPQYTDHKAWNVGTASWFDQQFGGAKLTFDTPSLVGVGNSAPYLHDGSAATLWDVVDHTKNKMGSTSQLNASQKEALVAYLQTL